jgi:hypothetical protein
VGLAQLGPALAAVVVGQVGLAGGLADEVEQRATGERAAEVDLAVGVGDGRPAGRLLRAARCTRASVRSMMSV